MVRYITAAALAAALLAAPVPGPVARAADAPADASPAVVVVRNGAVSVEARDADLGLVLERIATAAGFRLTTTGSLKRVTAVFTGVPLDEALRRLVQDHELMLIYGPAARGRPGVTLVEAHVFAASPAGPPVASPAALAEIEEMLRSRRGDPANAGRLVDFLASSDASVRSRAAQTLGTVGGPAAVAALQRALADPVAQVRVQAVYALRRVQGVQAIPSLAERLHDTDVSVRRAAVAALSTVREAAATDALQSATADPDETVRLQATHALQRLGVVAR